MPQLPQILRTIAALKREASELADRMNTVWQELDALEASLEQQEEPEMAA